MIDIRAEKGWQHCSRGATAHSAPTLLATLCLSVFFLTVAHGAQPSGNFEQEWSNLIAAAKQEGTVAIASGGGSPPALGPT